MVRGGEVCGKATFSARNSPDGPNLDDVDAFLSTVENEGRREGCRALVALLADVTGETPTMWGGSIIGFGSYHYVYDSGREGDWFLAGVAPRKHSLTVYLMDAFEDHDDLMAALGSYRTGRSCLYIKKLQDIDLDVLRELVARSVAGTRARYA
jgi:hypothetical protein